MQGWGLFIDGNGYGGGIYAGGGTLVLTSDTVTGNEAAGELGGVYIWGNGYGGGIEIASLAKVSLDSFTVTNTTNNDGQVVDSSGYHLHFVSNIDGTYILLP